MDRSRLIVLAVAFAVFLGRSPADAAAQDIPLEPPGNAAKVQLETAPAPPDESAGKPAPKPPTGVGRQSILALFAKVNPML